MNKPHQRLNDNKEDDYIQEAYRQMEYARLSESDNEDEDREPLPPPRPNKSMEQGRSMTRVEVRTRYPQCLNV